MRVMRTTTATTWAIASAALLALPFAATPAAAQWRAQRFDAQPATAEANGRTALDRSRWRPLRIAKWVTAATAVGTGVYGFMVQEDADDDYRDLEELCNLERERCRNLLPDGSYADPGLEARYQSIRDDYSTARLLLVVSQISLAGSIAFFILDLPEDPSPPNIPYEPEELEFGVRPSDDGGVLLEGRWRY